nr:unnamed protein product [Digitaria exilis]
MPLVRESASRDARKPRLSGPHLPGGHLSPLRGAHTSAVRKVLALTLVDRAERGQDGRKKWRSGKRESRTPAKREERESWLVHQGEMREEI